MNNRELLSYEYVAKGWTQDNSVILDEEDVSIKIECACGNEFWIYVPSTAHRCLCGKVYRVKISVEIEDV